MSNAFGDNDDPEIDVEHDFAERYLEAVADIRELGSIEAIALPDLPFDALAIPATDYLRALRVRREGGHAMNALLKRFDALIAPAHPRVASLLTEPISEEPKDQTLRTIGGTANLCGLPGISLPAGSGRDGLPTAVALTGRVDADAAVLAAAIAFQQQTAWHRQWPPAWNVRSQPEHAT